MVATIHQPRCRWRFNFAPQRAILLVWMSMLGFCLAAAAGLATTCILLDANFNDKTLNAAVGTGGPSVREPIFVHPQLQARVVAASDAGGK